VFIFFESVILSCTSKAKYRYIEVSSVTNNWRREVSVLFY
jgi:hypothetical protein